MPAARRASGALLAMVALAAAAAPAALPPIGQHAAELCVATGAAQPSCGPAQADVRRNGVLRVRVDDIVYRLELHSSQVEVVLMHGAMQIDGFRVQYEWAGSTLRFADVQRAARYEIRFAPPRQRR